MSRDNRISLLDREATTTRIDGLSLRAQSQMLGLNRSGLYYRSAPPCAEQLRLKRRIDEIYTARPFYGIRLLGPSNSSRKGGASITKLWLDT
jgi:hypothetical protein